MPRPSAFGENAAVARGRAVTPVDERPLLAIWELTQACDLACAHCRASATTRRDPRELSTEEGKRLLDAIAAMGTPLMILTGGDPSRRPDLVELVEHGASAGLAMATTPSGTVTTTRALLAELKAAGLSRLAVSVDGSDAATHDSFRGVDGSFAESVRILEDARALGLPTQVNTTLHAANVAGLAEMAAFVARTGAVLWSVFVVVPTGRAAPSLMLDAEALERALVELADISENASFDVKTTAAPHFRRVLMQRRARRAKVGLLEDVGPDGALRGPRGVTDGVGILFVSHRGDIYPSGFLPLRAGNVRTDDVASVYRDAPLFRRLRDVSLLEGKCGACAFKRVCAGSRARAFAMEGDAMGPDPLCAYMPPQLQNGGDA